MDVPVGMAAAGVDTPAVLTEDKPEAGPRTVQTGTKKVIRTLTKSI